MRRTSRLVLLLGIFLAAIVFVVILFLNPSSSGPGIVGPSAATELATVVATKDIPLGTVVTADMVGSQKLPVTARNADAYADVSQAIGQTARKPILTGAQVGSGDFAASSGIVPVPAGKRAFAVQVTELTGVGKLINVGDTVDVLISLDQNAIKVVTITPPLKSGFNHDDALNPLTVKAPLLLQDVQVIGTIDSPTAAVAQGAQASQAPSTTLTGTPKLIILAVTDAQAEALLYARTAGTIDLILRSPSDEGTTVATDGVILKTLFDKYGVLPPYLSTALDAFIPKQP